MDKSALKELLRLVAIRVSREAVIRRGDHTPYTEEEKRWAEDGPVHPSKMDSIREASYR